VIHHETQQRNLEMLAKSGLAVNVDRNEVHFPLLRCLTAKLAAGLSCSLGPAGSQEYLSRDRSFQPPGNRLDGLHALTKPGDGFAMRFQFVYAITARSGRRTC